MDENTLKLKLAVCTHAVCTPVIISFEIQSAGVQSQHNKKCVTVPILLEHTVSHISHLSSIIFSPPSSIRQSKRQSERSQRRGDDKQGAAGRLDNG
jgi:hypothetical protein